MTANEQPARSPSIGPLCAVALLDLVSITPFGAWLGFLAAGIAARVALRRRYSATQRTAAWLGGIVGLLLAVFWWWITSYSFY